MKRFSVKYANQLGTEKKYDELFAYANAHAEKKADAQAFLGLCYDCGYGVEQDREHAVKLFQESSDRGSAIGRFHLAYTYAYGSNGESGKAKAKELFYSLGCAQAHYYYALLCDDAQKEKELKWMFHPLFGYADAYVPAMIELGDLYESKKQLEKARKWYKKAAVSGSCFAKYALAKSYRTISNDPGRVYDYTDKDAFLYWMNEASMHSPETATYYLHEEFCYLNFSRLSGHHFDFAAAAHRELGDIYSVQVCGAENIDYKKARYHYEVAGMRLCENDAVFLIYSLQNLAELYHKGLGGPVNKERAFSLFCESLDIMERKNIQDGTWIFSALLYIGHAYLFGDGTEKNYDKALEHLNRAIAVDSSSKYGHQGTFFYIGYCYYFGCGAEKNVAEAAKYWQQGAKKDCVLSQIALGYLFEKGRGVEQDLNTANKLYAEGLKSMWMASLLHGRFEDFGDKEKESLSIIRGLELRDCFVQIESLSMQATNDKIRQEIQALEKQCLDLGPQLASARENAMMQKELIKEKTLAVNKQLRIG